MLISTAHLIVISVIVYVLRKNCRAAGWRRDSLIQSILNKNRIHCLKYKEYNKTLIEIKDTLLQKLNIYSKRLKRYRVSQNSRIKLKLYIP
jgi:hypothetical protein